MEQEKVDVTLDKNILLEELLKELGMQFERKNKLKAFRITLPLKNPIPLYVWVNKSWNSLRFYIPTLKEVPYRQRVKVRNLLLEENLPIVFGSFSIRDNKFVCYTFGVSLNRGEEFINKDEFMDYMSYITYHSNIIYKKIQEMV